MLAGGVGLGASAGAYAVGVEPRFRLVVTEWEIATAKWVHADPLRIVILADIHACEPWMSVARIGDIVATANSLRGDIILLLGDFVGSIDWLETRHVPPEEWGPPLAGLKAPLGVHAVPGNHDWWQNIDSVVNALRAAGVTIYQNRAQKFQTPAPFWLAGTDSMWAHRTRGGRFWGEDNLPRTLAQITDNAPAILMAHEPDLFVKVPNRFAVTLSGHTHGGQIWLPFLGRPVIPSAYGQRFAYGHIRENGRDLIVSAGLGCSILPARFAVPPEIAVVVLRSLPPMT
jgi:predicted MPP superfamily phosphohydrolase